MVKEKNYAIDQEKYRPYFPLHTVTKGKVNISQYFGLSLSCRITGYLSTTPWFKILWGEGCRSMELWCSIGRECNNLSLTIQITLISLMFMMCQLGDILANSTLTCTLERVNMVMRPALACGYDNAYLALWNLISYFIYVHAAIRTHKYVNLLSYIPKMWSDLQKLETIPQSEIVSV